MVSAERPQPLFSCAGLDTEKLFVYFRGEKRQDDLTVFIANLARNTVAKVFPPSGTEAAEHAARGLNAVQRASAAHQAHQLYYCVLLHVLQKRNPLQEVKEGRFHRCVIPDPAEVHRMLSIPDFHLGLLTCSLELVRAAALESHIPLSTPAKIGTNHSMLTVWDATNWFLDCFAGGEQSDRPWVSNTGLAYLTAVKCRCEEELVLADQSHFYEIVFTGGGSLYPGGSTTLVSAFLAALGTSATRHTVTAAQRVASSSSLPMAASDFILACTDLMDNVLMHHLDLLFGKHIATLIICCIYAVAKVIGGELSFRSVAHQVCQLFPGSSACSSEGEAHQEHLITSMRSFYNTVFLGACERMVRASASVPSSGAAARHAGSVHGWCPDGGNIPTEGVLAAACVRLKAHVAATVTTQAKKQEEVAQPLQHQQPPVWAQPSYDRFRLVR